MAGGEEGEEGEKRLVDLRRSSLMASPQVKMQYFDIPCATISLMELLPVGVGVGIDRNRTSPARLSEWSSRPQWSPARPLRGERGRRNRREMYNCRFSAFSHFRANNAAPPPRECSRVRVEVTLIFLGPSSFGLGSGHESADMRFTFNGAISKCRVSMEHLA